MSPRARQLWPRSLHGRTNDATLTLTPALGVWLSDDGATRPAVDVARLLAAEERVGPAVIIVSAA